MLTTATGGKAVIQTENTNARSGSEVSVLGAQELLLDDVTGLDP